MSVLPSSRLTHGDMPSERDDGVHDTGAANPP
jgi:hypothetical protein